MAEHRENKAPRDELKSKKDDDEGNRGEESALEDGEEESTRGDETHLTAEQLTAQIGNTIANFPENGTRRIRNALLPLKRLNSNDSTGKYIKLYSQQRMLQDLLKGNFPGHQEMLKNCDRHENYVWYAGALLYVTDIDKASLQFPPNWEENRHIWPRVFRTRDIINGVEKPHPSRVPKGSTPNRKTDDTEMAKAKRGREGDSETKPPAKKARRSEAQAKDMSSKDEAEDERFELEAVRRESPMGTIARSPQPLPYAGPRSSAENDDQLTAEPAGPSQLPLHENSQVLQLDGVQPTNVLHQANTSPQSTQHDLSIYGNAQALFTYDPFFGYPPVSSTQAGAAHDLDESLYNLDQQPHSQHSNMASHAARLQRSGALHYGREILSSFQSDSQSVRYLGDLRPGHAGDSASIPFHDHDQTAMSLADGLSQQTTGETPSNPNPSTGEDTSVDFSLLDEFFDYAKYSRDHDHTGH